MKVKIKVQTNVEQEQEAIAKNAHYAKERELNKQRSNKNKVLVPEDVEVPAKEVKIQEVYLDAKDISWMRLVDIETPEDMIEIKHEGRTLLIVNEPEVFEQLKQRFN